MFPAFSYAQMDVLCQELNKRLVNFEVIDCFPDNLKRFSLFFTHSTHQETLFFCFIPPFIRFHLITSSQAKYPSHPLLTFLKGAKFKRATLLNQDRILQLTFQTKQGLRLLIAEFFSKHPNYYLLQEDLKMIFSLYPLPNTYYQLPPRRLIENSSLSPIWLSHQEVADVYHKLEQEWKFKQEKQALCHSLNKQIKKLQKKEQELKQNLIECNNWFKIHHEGELLKANFTSVKKGISSLTVWDWLTNQSYQMNIDPNQTAQEAMSMRFRKAKKLQLGIDPLTKQLKNHQTHLQLLEQQLQQMFLCQTPEELNQFKTLFPHVVSSHPTTLTKTAASPIYREYLSDSGLKIWVGKTAQTNERLTFQLANGRDWWLHIQGYPGSHVIIRMSKDQFPDHETLQDAMQLALYYSKARDQGEGEVCFTQRKYVSKSGRKAKTGQVTISKHQIAWIKFDPVRYQHLKERGFKNDLLPH